MKHRLSSAWLRCLILGMACTTGGAEVQAANADTLHDIPSEITSLRNARDEIRYRHQAEADMIQVHRDLTSSRRNAGEAEANWQEAGKALTAARENVTTLTQDLKQTQQELGAARIASAERTREAIAAQQAVADYAPGLYSMRSTVADERSAYESLESQAQAVSQEYETAVKEAETEQQAHREEIVAEAAEAVGYALNRLDEAQQMVDDQEQNDDGESEHIESYYDGLMDDLDTQLEASSDALDEDQEALDHMQEHMDELMEAQSEAEQLEAESREQVASYEADVASLASELTQARKDETDAETYYQECRDWLNRAVSEEGQLAVAAQLQDYEWKHWGEGAGLTTGIEYYHWKGDHPGYQWFLPLTYTEQGRIHGRRVDFGISTGYLQSDTGLVDGTSSGMTDTQLSFMIHNDHPVNSVYYLLNFNIPTGQHAFYQNAIVPEGLAPFTDFGAGFEFTPGWEVVHHYNERDSLSGRIQYTFRGSYDYSKEVSGREVSPGDIFHQGLKYQHIGPKVQYSIQLQHNSNSSARQESIFQDEFGLWHPGDTLHYTDGDEWDVRWFYNRSMTPKDELSLYTIQNLTEKTKGFASEDAYAHYYGGGWMHHINKEQEYHILLHFKDVSSSTDPLRTELNNAGYRRYSWVAGYSWQSSPSESVSLDIERYIRHNDGANSYRGWGIVAVYNKSL